MRAREKKQEAEGRRRGGQPMTKEEALLAEGPSPVKKVDANVVDANVVDANVDEKIEMVCSRRLASHKTG